MEYNYETEHEYQNDLFREYCDLKLPNRGDHVTEAVETILDKVRFAARDIITKVNLSAPGTKNKPPFLTIKSNKTSSYDATKVKDLLQGDVLQDPNLLSAFTNEISILNNARLQYFVFFNIQEEGHAFGKILQVNDSQVWKMGVSRKEAEMIIFIVMGDSNQEALPTLMPYIPKNSMQEIVDKITEAFRQNENKTLGQDFKTYMRDCVDKIYRRLALDYDHL